jgi:hypothetical protein
MGARNVSREGSRPDPVAATELAHLPPRRGRTDEHWPPPPYRPLKNFADVASEHQLIRRDMGEQTRALSYVEGKAIRANEILDGVPGSKEPGLRTLVHALAEGLKAVNESVVKQQESTRSTQRSVVLALFVIAGALAWMAIRNGP